jgi:hypothetical protein
MPGRCRDPAACPARGPAVATDHAGAGRRLVQEHQPLGIEVRLSLKPSLARSSYVFSLLLSCVQRPFLRVIRCRAKKRDRLLVLIATPWS